MRFISICFFHFRTLLRNSYFVTLLITSTLSVVLLQYIVLYSSNSTTDSIIWLRSGIFGMWSIAVTSAGIIGFQRYQGTLPYLLNNQISDQVSMFGLVISTTHLGILAFPLSYLFTLLLGIDNMSITPIMMLAIFLLYIGCAIMSFLIAFIFVLTKNAIIYEPLITIPVLIVSGIFSLGNTIDRFMSVFAWLIPIASPIKLILGYSNSFILQSVSSILIFSIISFTLSFRIIKKARVDGKFGIL